MIEAPLEPILVVAGAGSGKTETMAARVVWLIAGGHVSPDEVLGLTFTRKAAGELAERIRGRLRALIRTGVWAPSEDETPEVTVSTYHAYAGRLVREYGLRIGLEPQSRLLTDASCWQLVTNIVERWSGPMDQITAAASTVSEAILELSGELAEHLVSLDQVDAFLSSHIDHLEALPYNEDGGSRQYRDITTILNKLKGRRQLLPLVAAYQRAKRDRDCLDFGDQLAYAARLSQTVPQIRLTERSRYRAVLLDEFQDTSHAQLVMLHQLFGAGHPVTAVGDPHQSIYGWRGASADTLAAFAEDFAGPAGPTAVRHLSTSWRNDHLILDAANATAGPLHQRTRVPVLSAKARPQAGPGAIRISTLVTAEEEADAVADWLAQRWSASSGKTAAILCRRRAQFTDIEPALIRRGLPYQIVGLGGLLSTPEVTDVLAALQVMHDPSRGDVLMRLLTGASCRLGPHDLMVLGAWSGQLHRDRAAMPQRARATEAADGGSLIEALDELPPVGWTDREGRELGATARQRLTRLGDTLRDLRGRTALALPDLIAEVERALLLDIEVASRPGVSPAQARAQLDALAQVASDFAATADYPTLSAFLSWVTAAQHKERGLEPGQVEVRGEVIQVLTAHAAKGLEWDLVAVPGLVEGSFPQHKSRVAIGAAGWQSPTVSHQGWLSGLGSLPYPLRGDAAALPALDWQAPHQQELIGRIQSFAEEVGEHLVAEERRLAYVAWTRARTDLLLTGHIWGAAKTPKIVSRFISELAPEVLHQNLAGQVSDTAQSRSTASLGLITADAAQTSPSLLARQEALSSDAPVPGSARSLPGIDLGVIAEIPDKEQEHPRRGEQVSIAWPQDPLHSRRAEVSAGAAQVRAALADARLLSAQAANPMPSQAQAGAETVPQLSEIIGLLLAERDRGRATISEVALPTHLSASRLVQLANDPAELALGLRRPVPREPVLAARRGTAFHAWVERHLGSSAMVDLFDLPGAADEDPNEATELAQLIAGFTSSEWASRAVIAVEVPLETPIDGTVIRGRVDAVFARADGGVDIVDWKTGAIPPGSQAAARAVQLAAYRLAWHRLHAVPLDQIGAAFCYVAHGVTVRPVDLMGERELKALLDLAH